MSALAEPTTMQVDAVALPLGHGSGREVVQLLGAAFRALDAYEAMRRRSPAAIASAARDPKLDYESRIYMRRIYALMRDRKLTFARFWGVFFR